MPPLSGLRVVRSAIDGYGVVATRAFAANELLAEVDGVAWREGENVDDKYSLWVDEGLYFDMVDQTRWINHSCDPNADVLVVGPTMLIVALREIAAGEEITVDYLNSFELDHSICKCRATSCRQNTVQTAA